MNFTLKNSHLLLKHFLNLIFTCLNTLKTQLNTVNIDFVEMRSQKRNVFIKNDCAQAIIRKSHL